MHNEVEVKSAKVQELEAVAAKCWEPVKSRLEAIKAKFEAIIRAAVAKSGVSGIEAIFRDSIDHAEVIWTAHNFERFEISFCEALSVAFREIAFGK